MFNFSTKEKRDLDEKLYAVVVEEIESGQIHKALWAKALAESGNDKDKTQALYIKIRVQKLYDEIHFEKERKETIAHAQAVAEIKRVKDEKVVATLATTTSNLLSSFKWLTTIMLILGVTGLFFSYITNSVSYDYSWWVLFFVSVCLVVFGGYLLFDCWKISKITDQKILKKKLNTFFLILIPFSAIGAIIGVLMPLLALFMLISCVFLIIHAIKYNRAYVYAIKNGIV